MSLTFFERWKYIHLWFHGGNCYICDMELHMFCLLNMIFCEHPLPIPLNVILHYSSAFQKRVSCKRHSEITLTTDAFRVWCLNKNTPQSPSFFSCLLIFYLQVQVTLRKGEWYHYSNQVFIRTLCAQKYCANQSIIMCYHILLTLNICVSQCKTNTEHA